MLDLLVARWQLVPDGEVLRTPGSALLPVRWRGRAAMLKVAHTQEEQTGNTLMVWLAGDGAARVYRHEGPALLMERVENARPLSDLPRAGQDDEATRILCGAVAALHRPRTQAPPALPDLPRWFESLWQSAPGAGGVLGLAARTAQELLAAPVDARPLHGDVHHGNVLLSRERGWLAIDPKGLWGERGFDYANILCNPDLAWAARPGRLARQVGLVAEVAGLERGRLLRWVLAYAGLSAAWWLEDAQDVQAQRTLEIARLAAAELGLAPA